jgi:predicted RNase H-like HicB family nuclease
MTTQRDTYRVDVTRERDAWLADVPEVPGVHTFTRSLSQLQRAVREAIIVMTDRPDDALNDFDLDIHYDIGDGLSAVEKARQAREAAEAAERESAAAIRDAVARLPAAMSIRDIATLLGISYQRVSQVRREGCAQERLRRRGAHR